MYGEVLDCKQWSTDFKNCQKWTWQSDEEAAVSLKSYSTGMQYYCLNNYYFVFSLQRSLIESETQRIDERLKPHLQNQVWKKRDKPPEDWNKPLPEFEALTKNSYLNVINEKGEEAVLLRNNCSVQ